MAGSRIKTLNSSGEQFMPRIKLFAAFVLIAAVVMTAACGGDDDATMPIETTKVTLNFSNMPQLDGLYYQAWALVGSYGYSLGKFNFNSSNQMIDTTGALITDNEFLIDVGLAYMDGIGITIEPEDDSLGTPTTYLLGGDVDGTSATLTTEHEAGMYASFSTLSGKYILATPTNGTGNDELSGIWFIDNSSGFASKGLNVPDLSSTWSYEAWVVIDGTPVSTGTFSSPSDADDSLLYGSTQTAPLFPGDDFLLNAPAGLTFPLDLSGKSVFVTVEINPDPDPDTPSPFKILEADIATGATDHLTYTMQVIASSNIPSGTATLEAQ